MAEVLLEKLLVPQQLRLAIFQTTRQVTEAFTTARHLSLPWAKLIQSTPSRPIFKMNSGLILTTICSSLTRDQVSSQYKSDTIIVLYTVIFVFRKRKGRQKIVDRTVAGIPQLQYPRTFCMHVTECSASFRDTQYSILNQPHSKGLAGYLHTVTVWAWDEPQ
jgi:hypothetical protein